MIANVTTDDDGDEEVDVSSTTTTAFFPAAIKKSKDNQSIDDDYYYVNENENDFLMNPMASFDLEEENENTLPITTTAIINSSDNE